MTITLPWYFGCQRFTKIITLAGVHFPVKLYVVKNCKSLQYIGISNKHRIDSNFKSFQLGFVHLF